MCFLNWHIKVWNKLKTKLTRNNLLNIKVNFHDFPIKLNEEYLYSVGVE